MTDLTRATADIPPGRATIVDVARAAQVSRQTVSNVLNRPDKVAAPTRERVLREIDRLGFTPHVTAQQLRRRKAAAYGFEVNPSGHGRMGHILDEFLVQLTVAAPAHGPHLMTFAPDPDDVIEGYRQTLATGLVDGFVLADTRPGDPRPQWLLDHHVPFVAFGRVWDLPELLQWVDVDGGTGVRDAVAHLVAAGYERIGFLGWPEGSPVGDDRRSGWVRATTELGLANPEWQAVSPQALEPASRAAAGLIDALGRGGALGCASAGLALRAWRVLAERGLTPGADLGLVCFDDTDIAQALDLSSLHQPLAQVADRVLHVLGARSASRDPAGGLLLPPELVVRSS